MNKKAWIRQFRPIFVLILALKEKRTSNSEHGITINSPGAD